MHFSCKCANYILCEISWAPFFIYIYFLHHRVYRCLWKCTFRSIVFEAIEHGCPIEDPTLAVAMVMTVAVVWPHLPYVLRQ